MHRYPRCAATIASPTPVLPDVGSTIVPPEPPGPPPPPTPPPPPGPPVGAAVATGSSKDRIRQAYQRRAETDYIFNFWTAFGWTLLTCGIFGLYVIYQLVRRARDHNQ